MRWLNEYKKFSSPLLHLLSSFLFLGVVSLSQALCSSDDYSNSLLHLDLSKNPGVLSGEDATVRTTTNKSKQYHAESLCKMCNRNFFFPQSLDNFANFMYVFIWTHSRTPALMFLVFGELISFNIQYLSQTLAKYLVASYCFRFITLSCTLSCSGEFCIPFLANCSLDVMISIYIYSLLKLWQGDSITNMSYQKLLQPGSLQCETPSELTSFFADSFRFCTLPIQSWFTALLNSFNYLIIDLTKL